jgi:ABC-type proline/glycine betaine transport system substrate-binding protein
MKNLGLLRYNVAYLGADAAPLAIQARLDAGLPAFFYLWSPHALNARYALNRIQLPQYSPARYEAALSDFPVDVLEKVAAKSLVELEPAVAELYSKFVVDTNVQESILSAVDADGLSAMQAACAWMQKEENVAVWEAWLPAEKLTCEVGNYAVNATSCTPCPPGSASTGGAATACAQCSAGTTPPFPLVM